jgi:hypothetical protein
LLVWKCPSEHALSETIIRFAILLIFHPAAAAHGPAATNHSYVNFTVIKTMDIPNVTINVTPTPRPPVNPYRPGERGLGEIFS